MKQFLFAAAGDQPAAANQSANEAQVTAVPETTATEVQPADSGAAAQKQQAQQQKGGLFGGMWVPMLIIFAIFYFLMIKPQQRKEKERRKMISELRAGTKVVFAGGLIGTIVEAKELTFKIEIAGDVVIEVARSAVQGVAAEDTPTTTEEPAKK